MKRSAEELRRQLLRRFIDVLIVAALKEREMTGYDVMLLLNKNYDLMISSGTIYSTLYSMEREGLLKGDSDGKRRVFRLTEQGMQKGELMKSTGRKVMVLLEGSAGTDCVATFRMFMHSWRFGECELWWFSWKLFGHFLHKQPHMDSWCADVLH